MADSDDMVARVQAWVSSPEGRTQMEEVMREAQEETAWMRPGTPENYAYIRATQEGLDAYDRGPIY